MAAWKSVLARRDRETCFQGLGNTDVPGIHWNTDSGVWCLFAFSSFVSLSHLGCVCLVTERVLKSPKKKTLIFLVEMYGGFSISKLYGHSCHSHSLTVLFKVRCQRANSLAVIKTLLLVSWNAGG